MRPATKIAAAQPTPLAPLPGPPRPHPLPPAHRRATSRPTAAQTARPEFAAFSTAPAAY